eukprot:TRINITY_DN1656_c0_g2_i3.p1 TRINITY_DN1656_c0_g2~~TRINITY_DN1656_c0_g2_i3.p1  ORF type:complete len:318 (+),score=48.41 TRINITY_DN1656_c0_g2_i3:166-1119(+)
MHGCKLLTLPSNLRKRLVKDYRIPIIVLDDPYFDYFMELYDPQFGCLDACQLLLQEAEIHGIQGFQDYWQSLHNSIVQDIKAKESYKRLVSDKLVDYSFNHKNTPKSSNVYQSYNDGKFFISVDIRSANFSILKYYDQDLVNGASDYKEFLSTYTDSEYLKNSKYYRQVIFGKLNMKKQKQLMKYLIFQIFNIFKENGLDNVHSFLNDEIILETTKDTWQEETAKIEELLIHFPVELHIEPFKLTRFSPYEFYVKEIYQDLDPEKIKPQFCNTIPSFFAQVYKHYYGIESHENDRKVLVEGMVATIDNPLKLTTSFV